MALEGRAPGEPGSSDEISFESFESELDESLGQDERRELQEIWSALGDVGTEEPDRSLEPAFLERMSQTVAEKRRPRVEAWSSSRPWVATLAVAAALILGIALGFSLAERRSARSAELNRIALELDQLRATLAAALEDGRSPSTRLNAIGASHSIEDPGTRVLDALIGAVESDHNVGVQLAAIDALDRFAAAHPGVRSRLFASLPNQRSPLVQMAVLDRARAAALEIVDSSLRDLLARDDLLPEVRESAHQILQATSSGRTNESESL